MILENCGGKAGSIVNDSGRSETNFEIIIKTDFISKILGFDIDEGIILEKLSMIGCDVKKIRK